MPFKDPTSGGIDLEDGRYLVKVKALEDAPEGQYGPGIKWIFNVATPEGEQVLDDRGFPAELWQFSSDSLSARSKGGQWAAALLNRALSPEDKGEQVGAALIGKKASVLIADNDAGRKAIIKMTPLAAAKPPEEPPDEVLLQPAVPATSAASAALPF